MYVKVGIDAGDFTYETQLPVKPGCMVVVPFKRTTKIGWVIDILREPNLPEVTKLRKVRQLISRKPVIENNLIQLAKWVANYYVAEVGHVIEHMLPQSVRRKSITRLLPKAKEFEIKNVRPQVDVLWEVDPTVRWNYYKHAIERTLSEGKDVLVLVPEHRDHRMLQDVPFYTSELRDSDKKRLWLALRRGDLRVVCGTRSAVFLPFRGLGLIIVEREDSKHYKEQDHPHYHARDVAIMRAMFEGIKVILGTGSPSLETYLNIKKGKYKLLNEPKFDGLKIDVITLRKKQIFSPELKRKIGNILQRGGKVVLFINLRGYSRYLICEDCGHTLRCPTCGVGLVYYRAGKLLRCHYCGYKEVAPTVCPNCRGTNIRYVRLGVERVVRRARALFPEVSIIQIDSDTPEPEASRWHEYQIVVGTEAIFRYVEFDKVDLVAVIDADSQLMFPNFRSYERLLQTIVRFYPAEIVIQTRRPWLPVIKYLRGGKMMEFYEDELHRRVGLGYPPHLHMVRVVVERKTSPTVGRVLDKVVDRLDGIRFLGPADCPLPNLRGKRRAHVLIKTEYPPALHDVLLGMYRELKVKVDVDPIEIV